MGFSLQNKIVSFIWSITDECLRDVYVHVTITFKIIQAFLVIFLRELHTELNFDDTFDRFHLLV